MAAQAQPQSQIVLLKDLPMIPGFMKDWDQFQQDLIRNIWGLDKYESRMSQSDWKIFQDLIMYGGKLPFSMAVDFAVDPTIQPLSYGEVYSFVMPEIELIQNELELDPHFWEYMGKFSIDLLCKNQRLSSTMCVEILLAKYEDYLKSPMILKMLNFDGELDQAVVKLELMFKKFYSK